MPYLVSYYFRFVAPWCQILTALSGAFLAGIIVPREGDLAILLTEKLEDMVTILFLPLVRVCRTCRFDKTHCFTVLHDLRVKH